MPKKKAPTYPYLTCRGLGHTWNRPIVARTHIVCVSRDCLVCGMSKEERYSLSGILIGRHYSRPDDYRIPGGAKRVDMREQLFR